MILVVDSWFEPTDAQLAAAKAHGAGAWLGYFSTGSDRVYHGWPDATFKRVLAAGLRTGAYCSGWADPVIWRARATRLGIPILLDCESSIRPDGAWVDGWLAASGAHLYGNGPRSGGGSTIANHRNHGHAGYVLADYSLGNQNTVWPAGDPVPNPARPLGWQYAGSVATSFGTVDFSHFHPLLLGGSTSQEIPTMGGCFKPGTHEYHWVAINPDDSVEHFWAMIDSNGNMSKPISEPLAGTATDTPTCSWSSDSAVFTVHLRGTDGAIYTRTWKQGWGVWQSTGAITKLLGGTGPPGPAGPPGPPGPPGTLPPTATVSGTVQLS